MSQLTLARGAANCARDTLATAGRAAQSPLAAQPGDSDRIPPEDEALAHVQLRTNAGDLDAMNIATAMTGVSESLCDANLTTDHRDDAQRFCAVAALASDARRLGNQAQASYAQGLDATLDQLTSIVESDRPLKSVHETPRERAIALYSQMLGVLVLSRAVASANQPLANEILSAARKDLLRAVGDETENTQARRRKANSKSPP